MFARPVLAEVCSRRGSRHAGIRSGASTAGGASTLPLGSPSGTAAGLILRRRVCRCAQHVRPRGGLCRFSSHAGTRATPPLDVRRRLLGKSLSPRSRRRNSASSVSGSHHSPSGRRAALTAAISVSSSVRRQVRGLTTSDILRARSALMDSHQRRPDLDVYDGRLSRPS